MSTIPCGMRCVCRMPRRPPKRSTIIRLRAFAGVSPACSKTTGIFVRKDIFLSLFVFSATNRFVLLFLPFVCMPPPCQHAATTAATVCCRPRAQEERYAWLTLTGWRRCHRTPAKGARAEEGGVLSWQHTAAGKVAGKSTPRPPPPALPCRRFKTFKTFVRRSVCLATRQRNGWACAAAVQASMAYRQRPPTGRYGGWRCRSSRRGEVAKRAGSKRPKARGSSGGHRRAQRAPAMVVSTS